MPLFLTRVDSPPLDDDNFSFSFNSWASTSIDTLNETILDIQDQFNGLSMPLIAAFATTAEIVAEAPGATDGSIWYATDANVFVGKANGSLVQFTVTPFP